MPQFAQMIAALCVILFSRVTLAQSSLLSSASSTTTGTVSAVGSAPAGCSTTRPETFGLFVTNTTESQADRSLEASLHTNSRRDNLQITLTGGTMIDADGRIGFITTNGEFTFQNPPLTDQLYIGPFSICQNSSIALGASAVWFECLNGSFYNLYYFKSASVTACTPIYLEEIASNSTSTTTSSAALSILTASSTMTSTTNSATSSSTASSVSKPTSHTGAIVGGVVGGLAALLLLAGAIVFFVFRHRKQQRHDYKPPPVAPSEMEAKPPVFPIEELDSSKPAAELHNSHVSELYGSSVPELSGHTPRKY